MSEVQACGLCVSKGDTDHVPSSTTSLLAYLLATKVKVSRLRPSYDLPAYMTYCEVVKREKSECLDMCQKLLGAALMELT